LTGYYLLIALGGVLGSITVSWLAPAVFDDYYELELGALAVFGLLIAGARNLARGERRMLYLGAGICAPLLLASVAWRAQDDSAQGHVLERRRGFLGPLRVVDTKHGRLLTHGRIRHGMQLRDSATSQLTTAPTMYFAEGTAIAQVMHMHAADRPRAIGIVGLGVGTLASYARAGDRVQFIELDEDVVELAHERFTFLQASPGRVDVRVGDGRLLLEHDAPHAFDLLVLDAFSSDAVPVHLLTHEAFAVYARQLAPDGVLLANVSNRHLAVERVVRAAARAVGLACEIVQTERDEALHRERVRWAVMARDRAQLEVLLGELPIAAQRDAPVLFTDTRASLLSILK
jgi:predicted O-methyltransferase YrrM